MTFALRKSFWKYLQCLMLFTVQKILQAAVISVLRRALNNKKALFDQLNAKNI